MQVGEIFVKLGFVSDSKALATFDDGIKSLSRNILSLVGISSLSLYGLNQIIDSSVKGAAALKSFSNTTGLSAQELQKWQAVAAQTDLNLTPESVQAGIQALQDNITQIQKFGTGNTLPFRAFGIDALTTDAFDSLRKVREKINQYDTATGVNLIKQMGLPPDMISVLKLSNDEFERLGRNFILTSEQSKRIQEVGLQMQMMNRELQFMKDQLVAQYAPVVFDKMREILPKVIELAKVAGESFGAMGRGLDKLGDAKYALYGIAAALAAIASPLVLISSLITGIIYGIDQLTKYMTGQKNIFSDWENFLDRKIGGFLRGAFGGQQGLQEYLNKANNPLSPGSPISSAVNNLSGQNTTINNVFNVQSTADSLGVSQSVFDIFQSTFKQRNNGVVN